VDFHGKIKNAIPFSSYVMDVVVYKDLKVHLIEFNPFGAHMSSGAALFNWLIDGPLLYGEIKRDKPAFFVLKELLNE